MIWKPIFCRDLSFNNLSGPTSKILAKDYRWGFLSSDFYYSFRRSSLFIEFENFLGKSMEELVNHLWICICGVKMNVRTCSSIFLSNAIFFFFFNLLFLGILPKKNVILDTALSFWVFKGYFLFQCCREHLSLLFILTNLHAYSQTSEWYYVNNPWQPFSFGTAHYFMDNDYISCFQKQIQSPGLAVIIIIGLLLLSLESVAHL